MEGQNSRDSDIREPMQEGKLDQRSHPEEESSDNSCTSRERSKLGLLLQIANYKHPTFSIALHYTCQPTQRQGSFSRGIASAN